MNMQKIAEAIVSIVGDYHTQHGFRFTPERVLTWVKQFEVDDRKFILEELLHLLKQGIYISEAKARMLLIARIEKLARIYKFSSTVAFLANADFLSLQNEEKSQTVLLELLDEELQKKYGMGLAQCGTAAKKFAIYIDDVLATGGSVFRDLNRWLPIKDVYGKSNFDKVLSEEIILSVYHFCNHKANTTLWRLNIAFNKKEIHKKIKIFFDYEVQNHLSFDGQKYNFTYPHESNKELIKDYFDSLPDYATKYEQKAFRKEGLPENESFFSSPDNRTRFENILLMKGIDLLDSAQTKHDNHRPLGATIPSYKLLGTGTLFFTWRNISNTTPIVFWWGAGGWLPLFPLYKRGQTGFEI
ncbi:MAG: hypothetical protein U0X40_11750 [Ferruginibacter sp.]